MECANRISPVTFTTVMINSIYDALIFAPRMVRSSSGTTNSTPGTSKYVLDKALSFDAAKYMLGKAIFVGVVNPFSNEVELVIR